MAKQKLTPEKRVALRKELAAKIKAGIPRVKILSSLSEKWKISTEGMRWYWNAASGNGTPKKSASRTQRQAAQRRRSLVKATKKAMDQMPAATVPAPKPSHPGNGLDLPDILKHTEGEFRRFLAAKKLVPHLEAATRREQELRKRVRSLSRELRAESTKARQLQREIRKLTTV